MRMTKAKTKTAELLYITKSNRNGCRTEPPGYRFYSFEHVDLDWAIHGFTGTRSRTSKGTASFIIDDVYDLTNGGYSGSCSKTRLKVLFKMEELNKMSKHHAINPKITYRNGVYFSHWASLFSMASGKKLPYFHGLGACPLLLKKGNSFFASVSFFLTRG